MSQNNRHSVLNSLKVKNELEVLPECSPNFNLPG